jgi:hypothetical protein
VCAEADYVLIEPVNSYTFVDNVFQNLADFGLELESFLEVYATTFAYPANVTAIETELLSSNEHITTNAFVNAQKDGNKRLRRSSKERAHPPNTHVHLNKPQSSSAVSASVITTADLPIISWGSTDSLANEQVFAWFTALNECYTSAFNNSVVNNLGATGFLELVAADCYNDGYAYVYASPYSVYNVSIFTGSLLV